ncbi:MAG TPA: ankyrin repeat domain-containing protein [Pyrinomonadaceae bacterium]|nr:ankyrin repeat domain-containing protein [Pyrinomonadaceae bacterium]
MNIDTIKTISARALVFAGTAVFSLAIMNSLPRVRHQRQQSFARATMDGNLRRMRWLHFAGAKIDARSSLGNPLFLAASEGKLEVVRYLLDEGADVNARANSDSTPLAEAAYYGHVDVIKELLLRGADINAIGEQGTALDIASNRKNTATADLLKHYGGKTRHEIRTGG